MGKIAQSIEARVQNIIAASPDVPDVTAGSASSPEPAEAAPPVAAGSGAESASAVNAPGDPPAGDAAGSSPELPDPNAQKTKHELLAEKLAAIRAQNEERRLKSETLTARKQAEADRKAAAEERSRYDSLKKGTFLETIKALGQDPREVFEQMKQEAIEAGKPETQIALMQQRFDAQLRELVDPLKKRLDAQDEELKRRDAEEAHRAFVGDYETKVKEPAYVDLRIEYGERRLFNLVASMKNSPQHFHASAKELGVKLTRADGRYTMTDILNVLDAAHKAHDTERKQRREQMQAPTTSTEAPQQAPATAKTVNGTAERRNAGTNPLGNDSAASKASAPGMKPRMSRQARLDRALERNASRRG